MHRPTGASFDLHAEQAGRSRESHADRAAAIENGVVDRTNGLKLSPPENGAATRVDRGQRPTDDAGDVAANPRHIAVVVDRNDRHCVCIQSRP